MSARIRGDHETPWGRWPTARASREGAPGANARQLPLIAADQLARSRAVGRWTRERRKNRLVVRWLLVLAVAATVAVPVVSRVLASSPTGTGLPATPRAWLDAYEAAAIDNPSRVCSELFAPPLAQAYATAMHATCTRYFTRITSFSVIVRRVLQDGDTAVLELRQTVRPRDWAVVLSREPTGWRAVDLLAGDLVH